MNTKFLLPKSREFHNQLSGYKLFLLVDYLSLPFQLHKVCSMKKYGGSLPQVEEKHEYLLGLPASGTELDDVTSRRGSTGGQRSLLRHGVSWVG
jgi:hypothetical protein